MPKLGEIFPSRFFKESDLAQPILVTIKKVTMDEVGRGADKETKAILHFAETEKELTLNKTNAKRIEKIAGDDTDKWTDVKIVVYWDPDIEFGGEIVGGVRVRAPKSVEPKKDDLPF